MKTMLLRLATVLLIGVALAGCAGTGTRTDVARDVARAGFCEPAGSTDLARSLQSCGY